MSIPNGNSSSNTPERDNDKGIENDGSRGNDDNGSNNNSTYKDDSSHLPSPVVEELPGGKERDKVQLLPTLESKKSGAESAEGGAETVLLPSVRCGIEMALVHLVARASGVPIGVAVSAASGLPCRGSILINGLAARGEKALPAGGNTVSFIPLFFRLLFEFTVAY